MLSLSWSKGTAEADDNGMAPADGQPVAAAVQCRYDQHGRDQAAAVATSSVSASAVTVSTIAAASVTPGTVAAAAVPATSLATTTMASASATIGPSSIFVTT
eukprot:scaffold3319_cov110-Isochrysis_galbana.AAC.1